MTETFAELWAKYPRKVAKKAAEKAFLKAVKAVPYRAIEASLDLMKATEWKGRQPEYVPHMASWLNRESFEFSPSPESPTECERPIGQHLCDACPVDHVWQEDGPLYNMNGNWVYACPEARNQVRAMTKSLSALPK
jgi:hypothetical protein